MKQAVLFVASLCVLLSGAFAQKSEKADDPSIDEEQVRRLEVELRQATLENDVEATDRLLAEDWVNTNANGSVTTKPQLMTLLKSAPFKFKSIEDADVVVRVFGDAAIVTGRSVRKRVGQDGKLTAQEVRFMRVYAKRRGRWQVVAAQATPVLQP